MAPMLDKEMAKIDWDNKTAQEIKNLVRGLNPIMGAFTFLNGKKIKFWKVDIVKDNSMYVSPMAPMKNGTVISADEKRGLFIKIYRRKKKRRKGGKGT
jgi:methionyl-tRNA formyltransferase